MHKYLLSSFVSALNKLSTYQFNNLQPASNAISLNRRNSQEQQQAMLFSEYGTEKQNMGVQFVNWLRIHKKLPSSRDRKRCFADFKNNVELIRDKKIEIDTNVRFIDKVDLSLDISTIRSVTPEEAVDIYKRQMRFISMYSKAANPFQTLRDLFSKASVFNRPTNYGYPMPEDFAGSFVNFLLDYYFDQYVSTESDWNIYVMQQRMALNEIESDVFTLLNGEELSRAIDENGEIQITIFSTTGMEIIADLLRPVRVTTPQVEHLQAAFTNNIWREYFPYTWALVYPKLAQHYMQNTFND